jgi:hypothetical protein
MSKVDGSMPGTVVRKEKWRYLTGDGECAQATDPDRTVAPNTGAGKDALPALNAGKASFPA